LPQEILYARGGIFNQPQADCVIFVEKWEYQKCYLSVC